MYMWCNLFNLAVRLCKIVMPIPASAWNICVPSSIISSRFSQVTLNRDTPSVPLNKALTNCKIHLLKYLTTYYFIIGYILFDKNNIVGAVEFNFT